MKYQERYKPTLVGVDGTVNYTGSSVGGFLCKTSGTITVQGLSENGVLTTFVDAHPVTAGIYYPLPFYTGLNGGIFTCAGGASGTLGT